MKNFIPSLLALVFMALFIAKTLESMSLADTNARLMRSSDNLSKANDNLLQADAALKRKVDAILSACSK